MRALIGLAPTHTTVFWKDSVPPGNHGDHYIHIQQVERSCKYYAIGEMVYRWQTPSDLEKDSIFRLKLTTDVPATTHLSGKLRLLHTDFSMARPSHWRNSDEFSVTQGAGLVFETIALALLIFGVTVRLHR